MRRDLRAGSWFSWLVAALAILTLHPSTGFGGVEPAPPGWKESSFSACREKTCVFQDPTGSNRYELSTGILTRHADGERLYTHPLIGESEKVLLAAISPAGNQIALVVARERISIRGRSGFGTGSVPAGPGSHGRIGASRPTGGVHPHDVDREHRVEIVNPKSGETIKFIDLGPFRPRELSLTPHGEKLFLAGTDLQRRRDEVRVYNTRSGKLEHLAELGKAGAVRLGSDGFRIGEQAWILTEPESLGTQRFNSRDPYSIAEYTVRCSGGDVGRYRGSTVAVKRFRGVESVELAQMLSNGLALKLSNAGFELVERERMEDLLDELWLQSTGATEAEQAAGLGRMSNAQYLALAELQEAGTVSSLTVRLVHVEKMTAVGGCEVACRDCRPDDYLEALEFLVRVWAGESPVGGGN